MQAEALEPTRVLAWKPTCSFTNGLQVDEGRAVWVSVQRQSVGHGGADVVLHLPLRWAPGCLSLMRRKDWKL